VWHVGQTRTSADFGRPSGSRLVTQTACQRRYDWVVDNLNYPLEPRGLSPRGQWCDGPYVARDLRRGVQRRAFLSDPSHRHVFHFTPKHGSWLNQVELWCSVLAPAVLKRGDFDSAHTFENPPD